MTMDCCVVPARVVAGVRTFEHQTTRMAVHATADPFNAMFCGLCFAFRHHCGTIGGQSAGSVTTRIGTPARYAATSSAIRCHAVRKRCSVT